MNSSSEHTRAPSAIGQTVCGASWRTFIPRYDAKNLPVRVRSFLGGNGLAVLHASIEPTHHSTHAGWRPVLYSSRGRGGTSADPAGRYSCHGEMLAFTERHGEQSGRLPWAWRYNHCVIELTLLSVFFGLESLMRALADGHSWHQRRLSGGVCISGAVIIRGYSEIQNSTVGRAPASDYLQSRVAELGRAGENKATRGANSQYPTTVCLCRVSNSLEVIRLWKLLFFPGEAS